MNYYFNSIRPDDLEKARAKGQHDITKARRKSAAMALIAAEFDGAYITKAILPKIKGHFPGASVYLSSPTYGDYIDLCLTYGQNYSDSIEFTICTKSSRRVVGSDLLKKSKSCAADADALEDDLNHLEDNVRIYNELAEAYAGIERELATFFENLPGSDWTLSEKYRKAITPEMFAATVVTA